MSENEELVLGVDIGGTNTVLGFVNAHGDCPQVSTMSTRPKEHPSLFVQRLHKQIESLREKIPPDAVFKGIGIASPAVNIHTGTIRRPANLDWGTVNIVSMMKELYDLPVALVNDGNAAALGEMEFGATKGIQNFIMITLGTGVGAGVVVDGRLVLGVDGLAGELGHVVVEPGGRECGCGRAGCLETYVSAGGICRTVTELLAKRTVDSPLRRTSFHDLSAKEVAGLAREGDAIAREAFEITGTRLGMFLADTVAMFDPEAFVLFGGVVNAGELLLQPLRTALASHVTPAFNGHVKVIVSHLQARQAGMLGAAALIFKPEHSLPRHASLSVE